MVGKLLSLDLKEHGVIVSIVHPGFMRTDMTRGVGFDRFWDDGGAVSPEMAAASLVQWVEGLGMERSGEYWAPRGPSEFLFWVSSSGVGVVLTWSRRYRDGRSDDWEGFAYAVAFTMVDDSMENNLYQLVLGRAMKTATKLIILLITSSTSN
jgi:NAD(P)-dependent dehydrogenase (short-subunit alcohol dehydrogenase family)